jgi:hypothetical protein
MMPRTGVRAALPAAFGLILLHAVVGCEDGAPIPGLWDEWTQGTLVEQVRIDGYEHDLVPISRLAVGTDGRIVVPQAQDRVLRFFREDGEPMGTFGGPGQGPGEFAWMARIGWVGDTLWVNDPVAGRITAVLPDLELGWTRPTTRTVRLPTGDGRSADIPNSSPVARYPDGTWLMSAVGGVSVELPSPFRGDSTALVRTDPDGRVLDLVLVRGPDPNASFRPGDGSVFAMPFALRTYTGVGTRGLRIALARPEVGPGEEVTVHLDVRDPEGEGVFSRSVEVPGVPLPRTAVDSVLDLMRDRGAAPQGLEAAVLESSPEVYPPLENLVVGMDGSIWVGIRQPDPDDRRYLVFASDGALQGWVGLPQRSRVMEATMDRVWAVELDEVDVPSVVTYSVGW